MFNIIMQGMVGTEFYPFSQFNILNWKLEGVCSASCPYKKTFLHKVIFPTIFSKRSSYNIRFFRLQLVVIFKGILKPQKWGGRHCYGIEPSRLPYNRRCFLKINKKGPGSLTEKLVSAFRVKKGASILRGFTLPKSQYLHRKKRFTSFPSPAGLSLTKLPLGRYNSVMTSLFPPRESLVVTSRLGTGNSRSFFYGVGSPSRYSPCTVSPLPPPHL